MRERIARALCEADGKNPDSYHFAGKLLWEAYTRDVDAVLNAMRELTPEMANAGGLAISDNDEAAPTFQAECAFRAMIDACLTNSGEVE